MRWPLVLLLAIIGLAFAAWLYAGGAADAHWKPQYGKADPVIQKWYRTQHNAQGEWCCDKSDGHPFYGAYALNKDGSVTLDLGKAGKRTLPTYMVLKGANPTGHAVWWWAPIGPDLHHDYCFAPGSLT